MKLLLYCTKAKPYLEYKQIPRTLMEIDNSFEGYRCSYKRTENDENFQLNGKIVAECDFEVEEINYRSAKFVCNRYYLRVLDKSCLTDKQMYDYLKGEKGHAIHIKNLHIFDEPRELSDYITKRCQFGKCSNCEYGKNEIHCATIDTPITKAPQNMMYCYDKNTGEKYVLISIRPEWLCKILNGEKTIECRKRILKEMMPK